MINMLVCSSRQSGYCLLDDEDEDLLAYTWRFSGSPPEKCYVYHEELGHIHLIVLERKLKRKLEPGEKGDHKDRNRLNNTRGNLRSATHNQNQANSVGWSGRKLPHGVYKQKNRFRAGFSYENQGYWVGSFLTANEAFDAFKKKHVEVCGEFSPYYEEITNDNQTTTHTRVG